MSTHNIYFYDKKQEIFSNIALNICFHELSEESQRDSKMSSNKPW